MQMIDAALAYARNGLKVFPCAKKIPLTGPGGFKHATTDESQIRKWWTEHPAAQIGLPTGKVNSLFVVDIDSEPAAALIARMNLPATFTVETQPGHWQAWFKLPEGVETKNSVGVLGPQIDTRGDGGYVVAPPSIHHETGKPYRVIKDLRWAEAPDFLLEPKRTPQLVSTDDAIPEGKRHQTMLSIAGGLRSRGLSHGAILKQLQITNQLECQPLLPDAELEKIASFVGGKPSGFSGSYRKSGLQEACAEIEIESFAGLVPERVEWLWRDRIPCGKLTIFGGDPGMGKSLVTLDVASRLSRGRSFCDGAPSQEADTIFLTAEDGTLDTVLPRLIAAGSNLLRIHRIKAVKVTLADGALGESHFSLDRDLEKLGEALERHHQVRLVVIDPISAYMGKVDTHRDAEVRRVLTPVAALAERKKVAMLAVMHLKKSEASALHRLSGSIGFTAAARAVWGFGEDPDDPENRVMVSVKNNLAARRDDGLGYKIDADADGVPVITWLGAVTAYADEVLSADLHEKRRRGQRTQAADWLRQQLANGPMPQQQIENRAEQEAFSWRTIRRAKAHLDIKTHKAGFGGGWIWELPETQKGEPI